MSDWHPHPSDYRWTLDSGAGYRPTISIIERPEEEERFRRQWESVMRDELVNEFVPFGFARVLLEDEQGHPLCGFPHYRNPAMFGGCINRHGHQGGHRYGTGDRKLTMIRPTKRRRDGHPYQRPGQEDPHTQDAAPKAKPAPPTPRSS
jgi:hypothetical protein